MFYKHWQKLALALTGFFWFACDSDTTSANGAEEPPVNSSDSIVPQSSDSVVPQSSEAAEPQSSETAEPQSSDAVVPQSSAVEENSSSSFTKIMPAYGVEMDYSSSSEVTPESSSSLEVIVTPLYGVQVDQFVCTQRGGESKFQCTDGNTCEKSVEETWEREYECFEGICPDYGVVSISKNVYKCSDGKTYSEAEFLAKYNTIVEQAPLYGIQTTFKK